MMEYCKAMAMNKLLLHTRSWLNKDKLDKGSQIQKNTYDYIYIELKPLTYDVRSYGNL